MIASVPPDMREVASQIGHRFGRTASIGGGPFNQLLSGIETWMILWVLRFCSFRSVPEHWLGDGAYRFPAAFFMGDSASSKPTFAIKEGNRQKQAAMGSELFAITQPARKLRRGTHQAGAITDLRF